MKSIANKLDSLKAQVNELEKQLSEETSLKKIELGNEIFRLLDNEKYKGEIDITDQYVMIDGEYYDKYTDVYIEDYKRRITNVYPSLDGDGWAEDEDGEEIYFEQHLTLEQVEEILQAVKDTIEENE